MKRATVILLASLVAFDGLAPLAGAQQAPSGRVPPSIGASRPRPPAAGAPTLTDEARKDRCDDLKGLADALEAEGATTPLRRRELADLRRMRDQLRCPSSETAAPPTQGRPDWSGTWAVHNGDPYHGAFAGRREATLVLRRSSAGTVVSQAAADPFKVWKLTCPTGAGGFDAYEGTMTVEPGGQLAYFEAFWTTTPEGKLGARVIACTDWAGTTETLLAGAYVQSGQGWRGGTFNMIKREGESGRYQGEQYEFSGMASGVGVWYGRRVTP